ncbi:hypothetical protein [Chroococcidiopsis sp. CCNUC1]|jgi:hypothetical protein|uniref:hypothetical protein n=1 Tax=Chroococcidiopsis sp. CCNUC1 TaxID=2653189 RepID=UPI002020F6F6|nr:hypothetical protein [Chroococcidiopsis sp. CCNUC1]URD53773.1 hypothetical protein M5J74_32275 [Chroococcidiopsis sp. CCNUC1]
MKLLKFSGHSDDIFQCTFGETATSSDETYVIDGIHAFLVQADNGDGLYVCGIYAPKIITSACWVVGVAQLGEDIPLPSWKTSYENKVNGYSPILVIQVPDDVVVKSVERTDCEAA